MKLKNVSWFERHIEKFIAAVIVLFCGAIIWMDVITASTTVSFSGEEVSPEEVKERVTRLAEELDARLDQDTSRLPPLPAPDFAARFRERLTRDLTAVRQFDYQFGDHPLDYGLFEALDRETTIPEYVVPTPPPPVALETSHGYGLLASPPEALVSAYDELIDSRRPRAIWWVSVGAEFEFDRWREALSASQGSRQPIPESIWREKQLLVDVTLERQRWNPETQSWSEAEVVPTLPTERDYAESRSTWTAAEGDQQKRRLRENQSEIARPSFVSLEAGPPWRPPGAQRRQLTPFERDQLREITAELNRVNARLEEIEAQMPDAPEGEGLDQAEPLDDAGRYAAAAGRAPAAGGGRPSGAGVRRILPPDEDPRVLRARLEDLQRRRAELIGVDRFDRFMAFEPGMDPTRIRRVPIWAHDITVEPGQTYRYRLRVEIMNPLFTTTTAELRPEQHARYANLLALASSPSEWTEPVTIRDDRPFFLVDSDPNQGSGTVEVWRIVAGRWQGRQFRVQPGDVIGGPVEATVNGETYQFDFTAGAIAVDFDFEHPASTGLNQTTTRMVFLDVEDSQLEERIAERDQRAPRRQELRDESMLAEPLATTRR